ncbi:MAG TPA: pyrimidine-nucleoside phosphorylase [Halanaerobiales bacterium]|nr:pyrimidine-nucleoside phosphorylase [Halanaerobiales bacterium]
MRVYDLILKKREGHELTKEEIDYLIKGFTNGNIPDYQMSAFAMAVYFNGMTDRETADLTMAMVESGDQIDLAKIEGTKVDKHSTGGVGDTTSLVLVPLVSAAGIPVAKMSGRGLGHTGGTIDKLESIPGFKTDLSMDKFINNVNNIKAAIAGQTGNLTPADKQLYALRDVTATIESIPMIASSIMSKKIAGGADGIVLDVKVGSGAFMKTLSNAKKLAEIMVNIGQHLGRNTIAVLTDMEQPLGYAVGNNLEVKEAINTLKGEGPSDLRELCLTLGANMLKLAGKVDGFKEGYEILVEKLTKGEAFNQFKKIVENQGGDLSYIENPAKFKKADHVFEVKAKSTGYLNQLKALDIGLAAMLVGAGREKKGDEILNEVGVILHKKYGEHVNKDEIIASLHYNKDDDNLIEAKEKLKNSFVIKDEVPKQRDLIFEIVD